MAQEHVRFGLFEFDSTTCELRREGSVVRLQAQPAQVLGCLIARRGEVVTREELCRAVWGSETHVDFERGLNFCIAQVRSALGDDAAAPRYVRTMPKRGYQFLAPVEEIPGKRTETAGTRPVEARPRSSVRLVAVACALAVLAACAWGAVRWLRRAPAGPAPIVAVARFDNETGDPAMQSLSDAITDSVVEQLTTRGGSRFRIVGNAAILRLPRGQRDLGAIAAAVGARYVILGQVLGSRNQTSTLAHLIRLSDQAHLWVVRVDSRSSDPLRGAPDAAQKITESFLPRLAQDSSGSPLPALPNR